jgi:hypothetical protein
MKLRKKNRLSIASPALLGLAKIAPRSVSAGPGPFLLAGRGARARLPAAIIRSLATNRHNRHVPRDSWTDSAYLPGGTGILPV